MEELKSKILSGEIRPGAKLPSENELAKEYEISRHTVRKALAILATDGYITTEHGKGTFRQDGAPEEFEKYCSGYDLYFRLHFSTSDPGDGSGTDGTGVQYHAEKYRKQPAERSTVPRRHSD